MTGEETPCVGLRGSTPKEGRHDYDGSCLKWAEKRFPPETVSVRVFKWRKAKAGHLMPSKCIVRIKASPALLKHLHKTAKTICKRLDDGVYDDPRKTITLR